MHSPHAAGSAGPYLGRSPPWSPLRRGTRADSLLRGADPQESPPPFPSPLLSLLGQKLGPRGGSRLQTKAEAPPG